LDEEAFKRPPQRTLRSEISSNNPTSNLEFQEDFFANEKDETFEQEDHFFENAVVFDDFNDDFMVDQPLPMSNSQQTITKDSDIIQDENDDYPIEPLNFVEDHFSVPSASELEEVKQEDQASEALTSVKNSTTTNIAGPSTGEIQGLMNTELSSPFDRMLFVDSPFKNPDHDGSSQLASEFAYMVDGHSDTSSQVSSRVDSDNSSVRDGKRPEQKNRSSRPKLSRSRKSKLDIKFDKINLEFDLFPKDNLLASRLLLLIRDLEILDNIKTSAWNKFLSHLRPDNDTNPRENKSNMVKIELTSVRPVLTDPVEELRLK
ncbi:8722_t:CDS:2, partial [Racocetra fulgida]